MVRTMLDDIGDILWENSLKDETIKGDEGNKLLVAKKILKIFELVLELNGYADRREIIGNLELHTLNALYQKDSATRSHFLGFAIYNQRRIIRSLEEKIKG